MFAFVFAQLVLAFTHVLVFGSLVLAFTHMFAFAFAQAISFGVYEGLWQDLVAHDFFDCGLCAGQLNFFRIYTNFGMTH